jgi:hypothetical protein
VSKFKPYRELVIVEAGEDMDGKPLIQYENGDPFVLTDIASVQRLVDCWNACRKPHNPAAHIETTEERVTRLEQLRKDARAIMATLKVKEVASMAPAGRVMQ